MYLNIDRWGNGSVMIKKMYKSWKLKQRWHIHQCFGQANGGWETNHLFFVASFLVLTFTDIYFLIYIVIESCITLVENVIVNFSYIFYLYCFLFILLKFKFNLMIFKRQKRGKNRHHFILLMLKFNEAKLTVLMAH